MSEVQSPREGVHTPAAIPTRRALIVLAVVNLAACVVTTVNNRNVVSDRQERFKVVGGGENPLISTWRVDGRAVVGEVRSRSCIRQETFTVTKTRTTKTEPNYAWGGLFLGASLVTLVAYEARDGGDYECNIGGCEEKDDFTNTTLWLSSALLAAAAGGTLFWTKTSEQKVLGAHRRFRQTEAPCVPPRGALGMKLAVKSPDEKGIAGLVDGQGRVRIPIPVALTLPPGEELPIVVVQAPLGSQLLHRGDVVGTLAVPSGDASLTPE